MRSDLRYRLVGGVGGMAIDALLGTVSFQVSMDPGYEALRDAGDPLIHVLWHGRLLPLTYLHRREGIVTMASRSEDGEYITRILERWEYGVIRGSSSRGGESALRRVVLEGRVGKSLAFTPDGPRGPKERIKPGVLMAARLTGHPIVPMTAGTARGWWIRSWDRFLVPKPFARVHVLYGAPHYIDRNATNGDVDRAAAALEAALSRLTREADERTARD